MHFHTRNDPTPNRKAMETVQIGEACSRRCAAKINDPRHFVLIAESVSSLG